MINLRCQPAYLLQAKAKRPAHACWPALQAPLPHPATSCMIRAIADTLRAALVAGVTATVSATAGALIAFTGDVSLPNLRLTGCDGGDSGGVLSFSGGTVDVTGAKVVGNNAGTGEQCSAVFRCPVLRRPDRV